MTFFEALFLGVLQGLTEFLPVSSSGHLTLLQNVLGFKHLETFVLFDLVIHLGTLLAIFLVFWKKILSLLRNGTQLAGILIAILPLFPLLLIIKPIKSLFDAPEYLGLFFLLTAFILYMGIRFGNTVQKKAPWRDSFIIGLFQTLAILPGVSRSGATVSGARLLGWSYEEALTFSFLLAIPTILGGTAVEGFQLWKGAAVAHPDIGLSDYLTGFFSSFVTGVFTLKFLINLGTSDKWMIFVWYCLILGICTTLYFNT